MIVKDLHPFVERELERTGKNTVFSPLLSCKHRWSVGHASDWTRAMAKINGSPDIEDKCSSCGTVAVRDAFSGAITELTADVEYNRLDAAGIGDALL